jgi:hypothetical protein
MTSIVMHALLLVGAPRDEMLLLTVRAGLFVGDEAFGGIKDRKLSAVTTNVAKA